MALVDNDKIEEFRGETFVGFLRLFGAGDRLVEREVDLVRGVDAPVLLVDGSPCSSP